MSSLGIDKINFTTREFTVRHDHKLTIQPQAFTPNSKEQREEPILWGTQKGMKAYLKNTPYYNFDISPKGLLVSFNPSKMMHPYNLTNDTHQVVELIDNIREYIKDNGILLPPNEALFISRFDMARNEPTDLPNSLYAPLFRSLKANRMTNKERPGSYDFHNKSRQFSFYDKTAEVQSRTKRGEAPIPIDPRIMRGELRAVKRDTVGRIYRVDDLESILKVGDNYRANKLKEFIKNSIFTPGKHEDQLEVFALDYDLELRKLKAMKERYKRNSIYEYIGSLGQTTLLRCYGNLENFRQMLLAAEYGDKYTFRAISKLRDGIHANSFFQTEDQTQNISKMYNEIYTKFTA